MPNYVILHLALSLRLGGNAAIWISILEDSQKKKTHMNISRVP